jgi:pSer/pThr/pTyr-binding forkhead associated (FHA) protein
MNGETELLLLRLGLIAVIFVFVAAVAIALRGALSPAGRPARVPTAVQGRGWRLVVVAPGETGLAPGVEFSVAGTMTIGRDMGAGIVLGDPSVSGRHAAIERVQGGWRLTDLGSTNGTSASGRPVGPGGVVLRGGEKIVLGSVVLRLTGP